MKKLIKKCLYLLLIYNVAAFSGEINATINMAQKKQSNIVRDNQYKKVIFAAKSRANIDATNGVMAHGHVQVQVPKAMVFISFSMSDIAIQQFLQEATEFGIPVVLRGLKDNSFNATAKKIFSLVRDKKQGGILLNPLWFTRFNIHKVPAVVVTRNGGFDVVYGNIPLKRALKIIADGGEERDVAQKILMEQSHA